MWATPPSEGELDTAINAYSAARLGMLGEAAAATVYREAAHFYGSDELSWRKGDIYDDARS